MFKQKVLLVAAVSAIALGGATGCARTFITTNAPSVEITPDTKSATTIADLDVSSSKVVGQATGKRKDRTLVKGEALMNAIRAGNGADVLVGAQVHERLVRNDLTITIVGYPARYRNFRPAPPRRADLFTVETVGGVTIIGYNKATAAMGADERGNITFTRMEENETATATPAPLPVVPQYVPAVSPAPAYSESVSTEEGDN